MSDFDRRLKRSPSISELSSAVVDTGRRGEPKPGCDCVQCFGYCLVDNDEARRQKWRTEPVSAAVDGVLLDEVRS